MILTRMSGAGNSFYVCDEWSESQGLEEAVRPSFAKKICRLFPEVPTDGFIILKKKVNFDFEWDFYNADGSHAEMCGNAARCVALYFNQRIRAQEKIRFLSGAGPVEAELLLDRRVRVVMPRTTKPKKAVQGYFSINTGVPHIVVESRADLNLAQSLRPLPEPSGSNVTFVSNVQEGASLITCNAVTFERGVEAWTAACGTGAVAAATYLRETRACSHSEIHMPGGVLEVIDHGLDQCSELIGPVRFDYEFEFYGSPQRILDWESR
jgi:diaminopimelate epimerase